MSSPDGLAPLSSLRAEISQRPLRNVGKSGVVALLINGERVVWLVRHGETTWNSLGWVQGQVDGARLTRRGRWQARDVAGQLAGEPVGLLYSSDLYRARRTAAVIARRCGLEVRTDRRLRERCFGIAEGVPAKLVPSALTGIEKGRVVNALARAPGGESLEDVYWRCASFLLDLEENPARDAAVVVVAHAGSVRMLEAVASGLQLHGLAWRAVPNGCVSRTTVPVMHSTSS